MNSKGKRLVNTIMTHKGYSLLCELDCKIGLVHAHFRANPNATKYHFTLQHSGTVAITHEEIKEHINYGRDTGRV